VGLTDDQKAMLRLLAQREEGYEDMAALMGISVEEVRARVKEALAEVDESDGIPAGVPDAPPAPAPSPPPPAPEPPSAATEEPSPAAGVATPAPAPSSSAPPAKTRLPRLKMPKDRGALIGLGAGALVVLIFAIVLIVSGGGSDSSSEPTAGETSLVENAGATAENEDLTQAVLSSVDGSDAAGRALFGRFKKNVLLQVEAEGLEPSPPGQTYTVWLYRTPKLSLQIGSVPVGQSGKIASQFQIPAQLLAYVANGAFNQVDVSLTPTAAYKAALAKAKAERKLPPHVGQSVLQGKITGPAIR
jgi:hypothetical protein